jgi:hypothetical protein
VTVAGLLVCYLDTVRLIAGRVVVREINHEALLAREAQGALGVPKVVHTLVEVDIDR